MQPSEITRGAPVYRFRRKKFRPDHQAATLFVLTREQWQEYEDNSWVKLDTHEASRMENDYTFAQARSSIDVEKEIWRNLVTTFAELILDSCPPMVETVDKLDLVQFFASGQARDTRAQFKQEYMNEFPSRASMHRSPPKVKRKDCGACGGTGYINHMMIRKVDLCSWCVE